MSQPERVTTLIPGLIVPLSIPVRGGRTNEREDLDSGQEEDGATFREYKTRTTIHNPEEMERATQIAGRARNLIRRVCCATPVGHLICPQGSESALFEAMKEARAIIAAFNATAETCEVIFSCIPCRIVDNREEAVQGIEREISRLLEDLDTATKAGNVAEIRKLATQARAVEKMIGETEASEARNDFDEAIKSARLVAKKVAKATRNSAKTAEEVIGGILDKQDHLSPIAKARLLFVPAETVDAVVEGEAPVPLAVGRSAALAGVSPEVTP